MFLLLLIGLPALEVFVFVEVGLAIGWLLAFVLLFGTSLLGVSLMRRRGRTAIERFSLAAAGHRASPRPVLDGALGFLGDALLVVPGFVTDLLGVLLLLRPSRALIRRWMSRRYGARAVSFAMATGRFAARGRRACPENVEGTVAEEPDDGEARVVEERGQQRLLSLSGAGARRRAMRRSLSCLRGRRGHV